MRWVGGVKEIYMKIEELGGVGDVLCFGFGWDISCAAVKCIFEVADALLEFYY